MSQVTITQLNPILSGSVDPAKDVLPIVSISGNTTNKITINELKQVLSISGGTTDLSNVSEDILPLFDGVYDIGSTSKRWFDGYFSNKVQIGDTASIMDDTGDLVINANTIVQGTISGIVGDFGDIVISGNTIENLGTGCSTEGIVINDTINVIGSILQNGEPINTSGGSPSIIVDTIGTNNTYRTPYTDFPLNSNIVCNNISYSVLVGGRGNILGDSASTSSIVGGVENKILSSIQYTPICSFIGGGSSNTISGSSLSSISGGLNNKLVHANKSSILGGELNCINVLNCGVTNHSIISGGYSHYITDSINGFIGGGSQHKIYLACCATIAGGSNNTISATTLFTTMSFIGGGGANSILGDTANSATIAGGSSNVICATGAFIGGGNSNIAGNGTSFFQSQVIGGGFCNCAIAGSSVIGGGVCNTTLGGVSSILGGSCNCIDGFSACSAISGGNCNKIEGSGSSFIGGGSANCITASGGILAGLNNLVCCSDSMIVGSNITTDRCCTTFVNNISIKNIPTISAGLPSGSVWSDGGTLKIVS